MPEGAFKNSGTGVKTGVLIVKKEKMNNNYKIFTDVAINIGFNYHTKHGERLYKLNNAGEYVLDGDNKKIVLTDLLDIKNKFKQFAYDENLNEFETENSNLEYNFLTIKDIKQNNSHIIRPETNTDFYITICKKIKQNNYLTLKDYEVDNKRSFTKIKTQEYFYIDISNLEKGNYLLSNKMYGWELPNRAKQSVKNMIL